MVGDVRTSSAWQPSSNGDLCIGQFDVCTSHRSQDIWRVPAGNPWRVLTVTLRGSAFSRFLLGLWLCHGIAVTADTFGGYRFLLLFLLAFSCSVQGAIPLVPL